MKTSLFLASLGVAAALALASPAARAEAVVGKPAPDFSLVDLDGQSHRLADLRGKVVVLEWINPNCPFSRRHSETKTMTTTAQKHPEATWLAVNSTAKGHPDFLAPAVHKSFLQKNTVGYPVLYDTSGDVGRAYGADTTPDMFVIDEKGILIYAGAIDDDPSGRKAAAQRTNYVDAALTQHAQGQPVATTTTRSYGCSVKY
jgi:peroxiredoxin